MYGQEQIDPRLLQAYMQQMQQQGPQQQMMMQDPYTQQEMPPSSGGGGVGGFMGGMLDTALFGMVPDSIYQTADNQSSVNAGSIAGLIGLLGAGGLGANALLKKGNGKGIGGLLKGLFGGGTKGAKNAAKNTEGKIAKAWKDKTAQEKANYFFGDKKAGLYGARPSYVGADGKLVVRTRFNEVINSSISEKTKVALNIKKARTDATANSFINDINKIDVKDVEAVNKFKGYYNTEINSFKKLNKHSGDGLTMLNKIKDIEKVAKNEVDVAKGKVLRTEHYNDFSKSGKHEYGLSKSSITNTERGVASEIQDRPRESIDRILSSLKEVPSADQKIILEKYLLKSILPEAQLASEFGKTPLADILKMANV